MSSLSARERSIITPKGIKYINRINGVPPIVKPPPEPKPIDSCRCPLCHGLGVVPIASGEVYIGVRDVLRFVSERREVSVYDLIGERRQLKIVRARQEAMWLARQVTTFSNTKIARHIGGRDHTTVSHGIVEVGRRMERDAAYAACLVEFRDELLRRAPPLAINRNNP